MMLWTRDIARKMGVTKAVIAAAGLGTRLLPATKEQPKEMLPLFSLTQDNNLCLKPVLQLVFEQSYDMGIREFCFVIGRGKRAIEDHFTQDHGYLYELERKGKGSHADELSRFYERLDDSTIVWINQPSPMGFGDAVRRAKPFVDESDFLVHAGDTCIMSNGDRHYLRLFEAFGTSVAAALVLKRTENIRQRGVVEAENIGDHIYRVSRAVEKPENFPSNLAIEPVYLFRPDIFQALESIGRGVGGEFQLTDAIDLLISQGSTVCAAELDASDVRLDVGDCSSYYRAFQDSYDYVLKNQRAVVPNLTRQPVPSDKKQRPAADVRQV